jgi:D-Tyr-tRNAtyr deacylase
MRAVVQRIEAASVTSTNDGPVTILIDSERRKD